MNKINRKIIFGTALSGAAAIALGIFAVTDNSSKSAVPVSATYEAQKPVIILDAGHGGSA